jgi:putative acetyltransferase
VRHCEANDAAGTREVFHAAVRRTALNHYTRAQAEAWAPDEINLDHWGRRRAAAWTVVAVGGDELVGFADLTDAGGMDMLFVHPDRGRRSIASALVAGVVRGAGLRGLRQVDVRASRVLQATLDRLGFALDEDRPGNRIGDEALPNATMHLDISSEQTP